MVYHFLIVFDLTKVKDLDEDGFDDLIVGSPFNSDVQSQGQVSIFNGHRGGLRNVSSQEISMVQLGSPDWFGFSLTKNDNSIFIGSPKVNEVHQFQFEPGVKVEVTTKYLPERAVIYGDDVRK